MGGNGVIDEVRHVFTEHQLADPLTKSGADPRKLDVGPYAKKGAPSIKELLPKDSEELPKGTS